MSAPVVPELNNSEVNRDTIVEVKISGVYTPFAGVKNFDPTTDNPTMQPENRYSDAGYGRSNKTGVDWSASLLVSYASLVSDPTSLDPALQFVVDLEGALGNDAEVDIRFYEFNPSVNSPRSYARQGKATVSTKLPGGEATGNKEATITLTGQGKLNKIVHPFPHAPSVPVVESVTPTSASHLAGGAFTLYGAHFTGTTGVTIGGVAVTVFNVNNDGEIVGVLPAGTAGANKAIIVTNATGASTGGATITLT